MAHNIYGIAYAGATPWHGLGERITDPAVRQSLPASMALAGIDFDAVREPLFLRDGRQCADRFAILRDSGDRPILGTVGPDYRIAQYREALGILQPLIEDHGVTIETVGALGQGEVAWLLCRLPDADVAPVAGDDVRGYFLVRASHDGSTAVTCRPTPIRVVCQNTLGTAMNGSKSLLSIRHTASVTDRIREASGIVKRLHAAMQAAGDTYAQLAQRRIGPAELAEYIRAILPDDRTTDHGSEASPVLAERRRTIARLTVIGRGADGTADGCTLWSAANAIAEYVDHVRPAEAQSASGQASAWRSAAFGANRGIVDAAFLQAARMLQAA